ncbi:MAG: hypothetical protein C4581_04090 [Nitrospiraceae bacterium]|nr:MAG: hypothetical protein C4581_04090 [Nitrospiraceae bacterium]
MSSDLTLITNEQNGNLLNRFQVLFKDTEFFDVLVGYFFTSIERLNKILADPDSPDVPHLEKEIDQLVYKLYDLTPEEIAIVEGKGK